MSEKSLEMKFEESFKEIYSECIRQYQSLVPLDIKKALFISYQYAQKEMQPKINELLSNSSLEEHKLSKLQQKLDTYIQLAETKGKELEYEKSQLEICASYCEVYTEDIKKLNTILSEARKVIAAMKDDLLHEGMTKYEGYLMAEEFLEKWK